VAGLSAKLKPLPFNSKITNYLYFFQRNSHRIQRQFFLANIALTTTYMGPISARWRYQSVIKKPFLTLFPEKNKMAVYLGPVAPPKIAVSSLVHRYKVA